MGYLKRLFCIFVDIYINFIKIITLYACTIQDYNKMDKI
jgi:hypothetical protein